MNYIINGVNCFYFSLFSIKTVTRNNVQIKIRSYLIKVVSITLSKLASYKIIFYGIKKCMKTNLCYIYLQRIINIFGYIRQKIRWTANSSLSSEQNL